MSKTADNRKYYDSFSETYDSERHHGYHVVIDEAEIKAVKPFCENRRVLEAGCGSGLILNRLNHIAKKAVGIDLSEGMLRKALERKTDVAQANMHDLPFPDATFDAVVSFKVLAHIEPIDAALAELVRITKPGGRLALEFYNPNSLRGMVKRLKQPSRTSDSFHDEDIITRYDTIDQIKSYLPENVEVEGVRGVRIFTPLAVVHKIPILKSIFRFLELASVNSFLSGFAGFIIVILKKKNH